MMYNLTEKEKQALIDFRDSCDKFSLIAMKSLNETMQNLTDSAINLSKAAYKTWIENINKGDG